MKKFNFKFLVSGVCNSHGEFGEPGEGTMKLDESKFSSGAIQAEMVKEAIDTFLLVTQPAKNYQDITELSVVVSDIKILAS